MGLERFFRRAHWDRQRMQEIESYIQIETDENIARGMPHAEAGAAARRKFGNPTRVREDIYGLNTMPVLDAVARDVRFGLRMLRRTPGFSIVALLTLGIGIGATVAVFSVVNSVLLKPLPYPNSEQLVAIRQNAPGAAGLASFADGLLLSPSMYCTYSDHNRSFQDMGVWATDSANVTGTAEPEQVRTILMTDGVLQALDVPPVLGHWFSTADQDPDGPKTLILSYGYWQRRFGGNRSVLGRIIRVDSKPREIIGVMPRGFRVVDSDFELLVPAAFDRRILKMAQFGWEGIGRRKPEITIGQADADIARLIPVWMDSWSNGPGTNPHFYEQWKITPAIRPLKQDVVGSVGNFLWIVMATVGLVLLIACANVTNLFLVRAEARQQELAVRAALGAGRARIIRELLLESMLLGSMGGALGLVLARAGLQLLVGIGPAHLPRLQEISLGGRAVVFTFVISLIASIWFGLLPAMKHAGPQISIGLRSAGRGSSASRDRQRTRNILVVGQVAIALLLLVSAGLMIRTFRALRNIDPGFADARHLQTIRTFIPQPLISDPTRVTRTQQAIAEKLAAIPGVTSVAFTDEMPMEDFGSDWDEIRAESSATQDEKKLPLRLFKYVSPGFFRTAGTRLIAGRELTWDDIYGQHQVVLISENLARELWGSASAALGKRLREFKEMPWHEVVGVVQDTRNNGVDKQSPAITYWPPLMKFLFGRNELDAQRSMTFVVRTERAGSQSLIRELQEGVWSVEPNLPVSWVRTMQSIYDHSLSRTSFALAMLGTAATVALGLGVIGIYGVISYSVSQRRREIGIRLALGAQNQQLKKMFVRSGLGLAAIGLGIGLVAAVALSRFMKSLLFGVSEMDPVTYIAVPIVLTTAAVVASYLPARRATKVDPIETLRAE